MASYRERAGNAVVRGLPVERVQQSRPQRFLPLAGRAGLKMRRYGGAPIRIAVQQPGAQFIQLDRVRVSAHIRINWFAHTTPSTV
jgi:hypothetical protein